MTRTMKNSGIEWIGEIPEAWCTVKIKYLCNFYNGYAFDSSDFKFDGNCSVVRIGDISQGTINLDTCAKVESDSTTLSKYALRKDDIVIALSGATIGKVGYIEITPDNTYINQRVAIIRSDINRLIYQWLNAGYISSNIPILSNSSAQPNISTQTIGNLFVSLPSSSLESQKIADFLDEKCSHIDSVLEKTRASIEEYKQLKQSVITQAVTKGIRPNRSMKDSGNLWFGNIPSDWNVFKAKYLFSIKKDIAGEEGYTVLSITQRGIIPKDISKNEGQMAENYSKYQLVSEGDFAMNHMDLLTGWVDISKYNGVTSPDYRVFVLNRKDICNKQFYLYLMQMCYFNKIFYGLGQGVSGLGRWRLQADKFLNFCLPNPPINEQQEIVSYLDEKCSEIDKLITKKERLIEDLETYKKSLIYEYVTGKKEV